MTKTNAEPTAFSLYLKGITLSEIERQLGISRETITKWKDDFNWEKRRQDLADEFEENLRRNYINVKFDAILLLREGLRQYYEKLLQGEVQITPSNAEKHILLLRELMKSYEGVENASPGSAKHVRQIFLEMQEERDKSKDTNIIKGRENLAFKNPIEIEKKYEDNHLLDKSEKTSSDQSYNELEVSDADVLSKNQFEELEELEKEIYGK